MSRATYVWSEKLQRLVEKGGPEHEQERAARSHLSAPMLIRDGMDALQSQVSGKFYDSKSALGAGIQASWRCRNGYGRQGNA